MAAITSPSRGTSRPSRAHLRVVCPDERLARRPGPAVYRRRRVLAAAMVFAALVLAKLLVGWLGSGPLSAPEPAASSSSAATSGPATRAASSSTYVVRSGDTIWSIARRLQPEGDVRPLVQQLDTQLDGPLRVGQRLDLALR